MGEVAEVVLVPTTLVGLPRCLDTATSPLTAVASAASAASLASTTLAESVLGVACRAVYINSITTVLQQC